MKALNNHQNRPTSDFFTLEKDLDGVITDVHILESHLDSVLTDVRKKQLIAERFQVLESHLLNLHSLSELVHYTLTEINALLELSNVSLLLVDEKNELTQWLKEDGISIENTRGLEILVNAQQLYKLFGNTARPYIGPYKKNRNTQFCFSHQKNLPNHVALLPLYRRGQYLGSLNLGSNHSLDLNSVSPTLLDHLSNLLSICLENILNFELLRRTSLTDPLTGVHNRRAFDQRIHEEINRAQRDGTSLSCLFLDIDHFKQVNDQHGHQTGDHVLVEIASEARAHLRSNDVLARFGGEEFIALMAGGSEEKAIEVAERIRQKVEQRLFETRLDDRIQVTLSIGVATLLPSKGFAKSTVKAADLIELADQALYKAKRGGRNSVVSCGTLPDDKNILKLNNVS